MVRGDSALKSVAAAQRVAEAVSVLTQLGLPPRQQNLRSALTLLALLGLTPEQPWSSASDPLCGITPMMEFFSEHYGQTYAPNSRETVRRQTVHQFEDYGLIVTNPDRPDRPINSGGYVYQIDQSALRLMRRFDTPGWNEALDTYLSSREAIMARYAQTRQRHRIPVTLPSGDALTLSGGGQNVLVKQIVEEFCPRFTPGARVLYLGDTDEKLALFDRRAFLDLGVDIQVHGKMPDVVVHHVDGNKDWLVLIEAVTSHGPIDPKRQFELEDEVFKGARVGLVFVTAFLSRRSMARCLPDISWRTEVWVADAPTHLIHFDGERFLGPY